jgi:hypothetical protein
MMDFKQGGTLEIETPEQQGLPHSVILFDLSKKGGQITFGGQVEMGKMRNLLIQTQEVSAQFTLKYPVSQKVWEETFGYVSVRRKSQTDGWVKITSTPRGFATTYTCNVIVTLTYHGVSNVDGRKTIGQTQRRMLFGKATWRCPYSQPAPPDLIRERDFVFQMILRAVANDAHCRKTIISVFQFLKAFRIAGTARNYVRGTPPTLKFLFRQMQTERGRMKIPPEYWKNFDAFEKASDDEYKEGLEKWVTPYMCQSIREAAYAALMSVARADKTGAIIIGLSEQHKKNTHPKGCKCNACEKSKDSHSAIKLTWDVKKWYKERYQCDPPPGAEEKKEVWIFDWYETLDIHRPSISPEQEWINRHK